MSRRKYIFYAVAGWISGLFILPYVLGLFGIHFSFADVFTWIFGEPNVISKGIVLLLTVLVLTIYGRRMYKESKKLT